MERLASGAVTVRLSALLLVLILAGCGETNLALRPVVGRDAPPRDYTFDIPEGYDLLDVRYATSLVALDDDPALTDVRESTTVQVYARHRETGEEALFVYDLTRELSVPTTVVRFRRVPELRRSAEERPPESRW